MPIFEYQCRQCNTKYEILHKSSTSSEEVSCPNCNSKENKKLLSTFSASISSSQSYSGCESGACGLPQGAGCASGMCGLN